jgi:Ca2+-binding EF-hand superfamily protein
MMVEFNEFLEIFFPKPHENVLKLQRYLKDIYLEYCGEIENKINKMILYEFLGFPYFIIEKLFSVLDRDADGFLSYTEFEKVFMLFTQGDLNEILEFLFEFLDFDKDGLIILDDVKFVLKLLTKFIHDRNDNGNVNIDGTLTVSSTNIKTTLDSKANDSEVVKLSGNQTVSGNKTYTANLISNRNISTNLFMGSNSGIYRQSTSLRNTALGEETYRGNATTQVNNIGTDNVSVGHNSLQLCEPLEVGKLLGCNSISSLHHLVLMMS